MEGKVGGSGWPIGSAAAGKRRGKSNYAVGGPLLQIELEVDETVVGVCASRGQRRAELVAEMDSAHRGAAPWGGTSTLALFRRRCLGRV
jgi:hypothetical protein